jgi:integrase
MYGESPYVCHTSVFFTGERFPVLLYRDTYQPVVLCTRYIIDVRRTTRQASTIARDVRVLGWFYEWCDSVGIDLERRLRVGRIPTLSEIQGFARYLRARRQEKVAGAISRPLQGPDQGIAVLQPQTFNDYLAVVEDFLVWAAYEFIPQNTPETQVREAIEGARHSIQRAFDVNRLAGNTRVRRYGLTDQEIAALREVIQPGDHRNPFKATTQFRNSLIVELLLATGIRRGELLKLKVTHLPQGPKQTLTIERGPDDPLDPRTTEPQVKTRPREIPVPRRLAIDLHRYVQRHRGRVKHPYLFTSTRNGRPLAVTAVNKLFEQLTEALPQLGRPLHPHLLRHSFNDQLMIKAEALGWDDDKRRKVQNFLNGWSENSTQSAAYTRGWIEAEAMKLAEEFQETLYEE